MRKASLGITLGLVLAAALIGPGPRPALAWGQPLAITPAQRRALASLKGRVKGEIVFCSRREGRWRLFRILADGSGLVRLTGGEANYSRPLFAPDGRRLIFQSDRRGPWQIYSARPDMSDMRLLSPAGQQEWHQGLTADGRYMLVAKKRDPGGYFLRELASGRTTPLRFDARQFRSGWLDASLSPDGRHLLFLFKPAGGGQAGRAVYYSRLENDGRVSGVRRGYLGCFIGWRRDGKAFLTSRFALMRGLPGTHIWLADLKGPRRRLTGGLAWNYFASFAPDAAWLVWGRSPIGHHDHHTGNYEIMVKALSGGEPVRLTFHRAPDIEPTWRPGRSDIKEPPADLYYEAEENSHQPGQVVAEGKAWGGKAVRVAGIRRPGMVIWGQYETLPPGRYRARFRLRREGKAGPQTAVKLDVAASAGRLILARRSLPASRLGPEYREVELSFRLKRVTKQVEFRVKALPGPGRLYIDAVRLGPAPPAAWHRTGLSP